ncbi:MAG: AF1514 family protein [Desulfobacterium sp.]
MQISPEKNTRKQETIQYKIDDPALDFVMAKNNVKEMVKTTYGNAMILSWKDGTTGHFYPTFECGDGKIDVEPWIYYARARGANLTMNVNDGKYIFMILVL